ncbi:GTPase [Pseudoalteromonas sp. OANN1]|uniref:GTPase n=1 Tax=Pseudoalteromonas sp. OANN1 TaxID=2954497 RepID=UPI0020968167|nr:GTPase [Pseudoalteromonas sp. OANN1]MCO7197583.1 50S ribosome-binding GTPase [Pseudoalteromonas sp. OANN1]
MKMKAKVYERWVDINTNPDRICDLNLRGCQITDEDIEILASSGVLQLFSEIDLCCNFISDKGVIVLSQSKSLKSLSRLDLSLNTIADEGFRALANSSYLTSLKFLDMRGNPSKGPGAIELVNSKNMRSVAVLKLNYLKLEVLKALLHSKNIRALSELYLGCECGDTAIKSIVESGFLRQIKKFTFESDFSDEGIIALANHEHLQSISTLVLDQGFEGGQPDEGSTPEAFNVLLNSKYISTVATFTLIRCGFTDDNIQSLVKSKYMKNIQKLKINECNISSNGVKILANSDLMSQMLELGLCENFTIGDKAAIALANSNKVKNLKKLSLQDNDIGIQGARALARSKNLQGLIHLDLRNNNLADIPENMHDDISALRRYFQLENLEAEKPLPFLRALIIGQPMVGKTTLFRALSDEQIDFGSLSRTQGFERSVISIPVERVGQPLINVRLNLMDLGGQEIQMMAHSLFFKESALYLIVVNQDTQGSEVRFWLEHIESNIPEPLDATILPIINPSIGQKRQNISANYLHELYPESKKRFRISDQVFFHLNTEEMKSKLCVTADAENIKKAISSSLSHFSFKTGFGVYIEISEYIESSLMDLFPEPFYEIRAFMQVIKCDNKINKLLASTLTKAGISLDELPEYRKDTLRYLDYMGTITILGNRGINNENEEKWVIVHPDLIQKGLYCLFPPQDESCENFHYKSEFYGKLISREQKLGIAGLITVEDFKKLVHYEFRDTALFYEDSHQFSKDLLDILSNKKLGFMIPLDRERYMIPAYTEHIFPHNEELLTKKVLDSWSKAQYAYVLELVHKGNNILFPKYFLYKLMVHFSKGAKGRATNYLDGLVYTCTDSIQSNRFILKCENSSEIYVELIGLKGRIWCFGFTKDPELSHKVGGLAKEVYDNIFRYFYSETGKTQSKICQSIPCPACLEHLVKEWNQNRSQSNFSLQDSCMFVNGEEESYSSGYFQCKKKGKRYRPSELKEYLYGRNLAGQCPGAQNFEEVANYTAIIYEFLHDQGLSKPFSSKGDALPNLFAGKGTGVSEKSIAKLVRWHYEHSTESMPEENTIRKAMEHLIISIPIFRVWAGINTTSKKVALELYYGKIKHVALEIKCNSRELILVWEQTYPLVEKRKVIKCLRDK